MVNTEKISEARLIIKQWRNKDLSVGFVPTMGYLHEGHKSLIERARAENDRVAVSIFVNPIQFGPNEDFEKYPRDLKHDLDMCRAAGADMIFSPSADEMYPLKSLAYVDVNELGENLCGKDRKSVV